MNIYPTVVLHNWAITKALQGVLIFKKKPIIIIIMLSKESKYKELNWEEDKKATEKWVGGIIHSNLIKSD